MLRSVPLSATVRCLRGGTFRAFATSPPSSSNVDSGGKPAASGSGADNGGKDLALAEKRRAMIDRMIRVDHAGELGANQIYVGQMLVLRNTSVADTIKHMWEQEKEHLQTFERLIPKHRVRPTALLPFWNMAGFMLGAGSALLGKEGAMACTVAVEEVIGEHYNNQIRELMEDDPQVHKDLIEKIKKCRDDELEHYDTGLKLDAEKAPFYAVMKQGIQMACRASIWVAERV